MATTKIKVYNRVLDHLGITRLDPTHGLTERRIERFEIDSAYDDALTEVLESAIWYFALRFIKIMPDPEIVALFGRRCAYPKPEDMTEHGLHGLYQDERGAAPLLDWKERNGIYFADVQPLYMEYVSNSDDHGRNLGKMGQAFVNLWAAKIAERIIGRVTGSRVDRNDMIAISRKAMDEAKVREAVDQPIKFKPAGSWSSARARNTSSVIISNGNIRWGR